MKIKKIMETRLDILNIQDMYCADYEAMLLRKLKDKYRNRCFKSIYILDILSIIKRSSIQCKSKVLDGTVYSDITFEVIGIIYENGDIIHNCKIIKISDNGSIIHAKSEYSPILIKNIKEIHIFKESDEIPVLVKNARYNIYDDEIAVSAIPLVPILKKSVIYNVTGMVDKDEIVTLFDFDELKKMENSLSKSNKVVYKFFRDLLYPFKKSPSLPGKKHKITLENLLILSNTMIYLPDSYLDDDNYFTVSDSDKNKIINIYGETTTLDISAKDAALYILNMYYRNLYHFIEFLEIYDTTDKIKQYSHAWSLYKTFKK